MYKLLVISNYNNETSSRPEAEIFIHLAKDYGFDISVMTYEGSFYAQKFKDANIKVIDFHPIKKFDSSEISIIRKELLNGNYDVVHLFNSKSIINGLQAARGINTKVVIYRGYTGNVHWYDPSAYFKVLHPRVDKIWCNSLSVKTQIDKQLFFNRTKTIVITKGHDSNWYSEVSKVDLLEFGITENDFVVVTAANDRKMKGLKYLLAAIEMIESQIPLKIIIMGGNSEFADTYKKLLKCNQDKVIFTGFRKDNLGIVKAADVFISSSIKGESFQKSVAEAMHLGICPVITDIPGNIGMVKDKECGLVIPAKNPVAIKNALQYLYFNRDKCKEFGNTAKKYISENYHFNITVKKVADFYRQILK